MGEHVAGAHAEVVGERSLKVLEVAAGLVDELEPDLALGRAAADEDLVAAVGQAEEVKGLEAARERARREGRGTRLELVRRAQRRRVDNGVVGALPAVTARVE